MVRVWLLLGMWGGALASTPTVAATLFRCEGGDGGRSYVSKRTPGARCAAINNNYPARSTASRVAVPATVSSDVKVVDGIPAVGGANLPTTATNTPLTVTTRAIEVPAGKRLQQGQVYSYIKDGVRHYVSRPPSGVDGASALRTIKYSFMETCYACGALPGINFGNVRLNTSAYETEIRTAARDHGVDEAIVRAIIHAESSFNPNAVSRVGAQGLMQLMPPTARRFGVGNSFDAGQNIRGGVKYLAWLLKRYQGNLTLAAAGYNAGEGAVDRYKGVPPYSETRRYVQRVGVLAERYRGVLATN